MVFMLATLGRSFRDLYGSLTSLPVGQDSSWIGQIHAYWISLALSPCWRDRKCRDGTMAAQRNLDPVEGTVGMSSFASAHESGRGRGVSRVLIIVQNLPVPFDRRVWLECQALVSAGYRVAVVCPKGDRDPPYQVIDTVQLYKYRP